MQRILDTLYEQSANGCTFNNLMQFILSENNIKMAYRNVKTNTGSMTCGTDGLTIKDISNLTEEEVVEKVKYFLIGSKHGYRPKPVRRIDIDKPGGGKRPLGIPCIWDRLIQQCIKQILEPICEAKFSNNSYGFRPGRCVEHAIQKHYRLMQVSHCNYVVEFDIKGFFDNVKHTKLIKQMWALGIRDKTLIYIIKQMLKCPVKLRNGKILYPDKGTPQGGILSPLLANIVLNELDEWIDNQWQNNPITGNYSKRFNRNGAITHNGYRAMRNTKLKEIYIIRYADDFRILCKDYKTASKIYNATKDWLGTRLSLELSENKCRIVNTKKKYTEFLGFKIKLRKKANKYVVVSHMSDKAKTKTINKLKEQIKKITYPKNNSDEAKQVWLYNEMVMGIHNYYQIATDINLDCADINRIIMTVITARLKRSKGGNRLVKIGRKLTDFENQKYGKSHMIRFLAGSKEPIYPIGYISTRNPMCKNTKACMYTQEGREIIHKKLGINTDILRQLAKQPINGNIELHDNRISLYSGQQGKCAVTGEYFLNHHEIECHHILPKKFGGTDKYENLCLIKQEIHILIHATTQETIDRYITFINNPKSLRKLNILREKVGNDPIVKQLNDK